MRIIHYPYKLKIIPDGYKPPRILLLKNTLYIWQMKGINSLIIKYAVIISIFTLIWIVFEQLIGLQDVYIEWHKLVTNFKLIIPVIGIWLAIREFKMAKMSKFNFQKGFAIGFKITLINALLIIPIIYLFFEFINPDWTMNMMEYAKLEALKEGEDPVKAADEARSYFSMNYTIIQSVIETFIFGTLISSVIAFSMKSRGKAKSSWA